VVAQAASSEAARSTRGIRTVDSPVAGAEGIMPLAGGVAR
jgi:hypothetical protein